MEKLLLVVEDNPVMANSLSEFLGELFDGVRVASTVDEAQDFLASTIFSLITIDINLKGRNGSEVIKFIQDTDSNPNKNVPIIIISGMVGPEFIEKNKQRFAGVFGKPFQINELLDTAMAALKNQSETKEDKVELDSFDRVPFLKCKIPFSLPDLDSRVALVLAQAKKDGTPKAILSSIKVVRNSPNFFSAHSNILAGLLLGLATQQAWNSDKTFEKLLYATYLHDIALYDKPHLVKINSLEQLESQKTALDSYDYKLVFEHPNIAATTVAGIPNIDVDVLTIIRQHHELPDETGFPAKVSHKKIIPMSALFIIANDLTDYILENPQGTIDTYIPLAKAKFKGFIFLKILAAITDVKRYIKFS